MSRMRACIEPLTSGTQKDGVDLISGDVEISPCRATIG